MCLILGIKPEQLDALSLPRSRFIPMSFEYYVPDLIAAVDVVMGKIGYGFVSECIANGTPLIYVPRSDWPEEQYVGMCTLSACNMHVCMYVCMYV